MVATRWEKKGGKGKGTTAKAKAKCYEVPQIVIRRTDSIDRSARRFMNSWADSACTEETVTGMSANQAATVVQSAFRSRQARKRYQERRLAEKRRTICGLLCTKVDALPLLHPMSPVKIAWDVLSMFFLVYNIIIVPYRIAWDSNATVTSNWFILESLIDWFFVLDIFLNFRTAVVKHQTGVITEDSLEIAKEYWRTWFLIDFVSSCPIDFFVMTVGNPEGGSVKMLKLFRILRLSKLLKLIKILKVASIFEELQDYYYISDTYKKIFMMLSITIYLSHMLACIWMYTTRTDDEGWYQNEER
jgi:hypothetical protein